MGTKSIRQTFGNAVVGLFALLLLQGCGLKGDLYLEDDQGAAATVGEQEAENLTDKSPGESAVGEGTEEFLEDSLEEQSDDIASGEEPSFEEADRELMEDSTEGKSPEIIEAQ